MAHKVESDGGGKRVSRKKQDRAIVDIAKSDGLAWLQGKLPELEETTPGHDLCQMIGKTDGGAAGRDQQVMPACCLDELRQDRLGIVLAIPRSVTSAPAVSNIRDSIGRLVS